MTSPNPSLLCECGHYGSSHTEHGCTFRPDCLCVQFKPQQADPQKADLYMGRVIERFLDVR